MHEVVTGRSRYRVDAHVTEKDAAALSVTFVDQDGEISERGRIVLPRAQLSSFRKAIDEVLREVESQKRPKAYSLDDLRAKNPASHTPWTPEEESALLSEYDSAQPISEIATTHLRTEGAIRSRLEKLGRLSRTD
jgi:hypothetical protein